MSAASAPWSPPTAREHARSTAARTSSTRRTAMLAVLVGAAAYSFVLPTPRLPAACRAGGRGAAPVSFENTEEVDPGEVAGLRNSRLPVYPAHHRRREPHHRGSNPERNVPDASQFVPSLDRGSSLFPVQASNLTQLETPPTPP